MHTTEADVITQVRGFIQENFLYMRPNFEVGADDRLLEQGIIDSMGVLEVVGFLESEFGVLVHDHEITEHNMRSVTSLAHYIAEKRAAQKPA